MLQHQKSLTCPDLDLKVLYVVWEVLDDIMQDIVWMLSGKPMLTLET